MGRVKCANFLEKAANIGGIRNYELLTLVFKSRNHRRTFQRLIIFGLQFAIPEFRLIFALLLTVKPWQ